MRLTSDTFPEGGLIPATFTCDGANVSPPLAWHDVPVKAKSLALIVDDPDAPRGVFVHWLLFNIAATEKGLTQGVGAEGPRTANGRQGRNSFGKVAYGGPCPPSGTHRYQFHLYALDVSLDLEPGVSRHN